MISPRATRRPASRAADWPECGLIERIQDEPVQVAVVNAELLELELSPDSRIVLDRSTDRSLAELQQAVAEEELDGVLIPLLLVFVEKRIDLGGQLLVFGDSRRARLIVAGGKTHVFFEQHQIDRRVDAADQTDRVIS